MKLNELVKNIVLSIAGLFLPIYTNARKLFPTANNLFYFKDKSTKSIGGNSAGTDIISS